MPEEKQQLRALGFCGADDSVHPHHLVVLANAFPLVEFGVLFRPDSEGQPRYATRAWVERLAAAAANKTLKLAAHLCASRVQDVLKGETAFVSQLVRDWGFGRVQINATTVNGVDTSRLRESVPNLCRVIEAFPEAEFILQKNDETEPLWQGLLDYYKQHASKGLPANVSMLVDESKGTGVVAKSWPRASDAPCPIGYAGGIGPGNIQNVLEKVVDAAQGELFWIDMESSLRSAKNGEDVFDLDKCYVVMEAVCDAGLMGRPEYLQR